MQTFLRKLVRRQTNKPSNDVDNTDENEATEPNGETLDRHLSLVALTCLSISNSIGSGKSNSYKYFKTCNPCFYLNKESMF